MSARTTTFASTERSTLSTTRGDCRSKPSTRPAPPACLWWTCSHDSGKPEPRHSTSERGRTTGTLRVKRSVRGSSPTGWLPRNGSTGSARRVGVRCRAGRPGAALRLPTVRASLRSRPPGGSSISARRGHMISGKRVLLVGDSGGTIGASEGPLRRADVEVVLARGGEEAITRHRERAVDLIVADLDLPDMSAERLCEVVRNDSTLRNVSLLVLCGADEADRRRAADCR